jgi:hypothetical protein
MLARSRAATETTLQTIVGAGGFFIASIPIDSSKPVAKKPGYRETVATFE